MSAADDKVLIALNRARGTGLTGLTGSEASDHTGVLLNTARVVLHMMEKEGDAVVKGTRPNLRGARGARLRAAGLGDAMSAQDEAYKAMLAGGWTPGTLIDVLCQFIDRKGLAADLASELVAQLDEEEDLLPQEGEDEEDGE